MALGFDFGHTDPTFILPVGGRAAADFTGEPALELLESGVARSA
jgi:muramoyltetrapeptide carboxypeptidase LdcA involved in peptidoglycan recycling